MLIDISGLDDGRSVTASFTSKISIPPEYNLNGNILEAEVEARITKAGDDYKFSGSLKAEALFECAKCLAPVIYPIEIEMEEVFSNATLANPSDEDEVWTFKGSEIDLTPAVLSNILLEIPYKVVCDENCKGLCPVCGCNRNLEECDCDSSKIDFRLEGLRSFFDNSDES